MNIYHRRNFLFALLCISLLFVIPVNSTAQPRLDLIHTYNNGADEEFWDLYALPDGGFAVCGLSGGEALVMRTDPRNGDPEWITIPLRDQGSSRYVSIIEADNHDLVCGGGHQGQIAAARLTSDGEVVWTRNYGAGFCNAVIELKEGDFMLAGYQDNLGILIRINGDEGEPVWARTYSPGYRGRFRAMRETDGEVVAAGYGRSQRGQFLDRAWVVKAETGEGEVVWARYYDDLLAGIEAMVSTGDGGFVLTGELADPDRGLQDALMLKIDEQGGISWRNHVEGEIDHYSYGVARLPDDGFACGGWRVGPETPYVIRTDREGQIRWQAEYEFEDIEDLGAGKFISLIKGIHGEIVACGTVFHEMNGNRDGLVMRLEPDILHNQYLIHSPEDTVFTILPDTTIDFIVAPRNIAWDELDYFWRHQEDTLVADTICSVNFEDLGEEIVECRVSQDELEITIRWHITVTDLYVSHFTPDTLSLSIRRGESVDFSLDTVKAIEGDAIEYLWLKRSVDIVDEIDTVGLESGVTIPFLQSGHYRVDGMAYRGGSSDVVSWDVSVRGAIWAFAPEDLAFEVLPDSTVNFIVEPTVPDAEGQTIQWLIDGELAAVDTTNFEWQFADRFGNLSYQSQVQVVVADSADSDTVTWTVTVIDPDNVGDNDAGQAGTPVLLSVSPNPFNSTLTVTFATGSAAHPTRLAIFDISGRLVADFSKTTPPYSPPSIKGGISTVTWNASAIPTGVYFVRLQSNSKIVTKKVILMR